VKKISVIAAVLLSGIDAALAEIADRRPIIDLSPVLLSSVRNILQ